jgi:peroxiredoxin
VADNLFAFTAPKGWNETEMIVLPMEERAQLTGQRAASFTLKALDGSEMSLAELRGKVVVMDFWATRCPPCRKELPELEKLHKELGAEGIVFVGVNDEDSGTVRGFVSKNGYAIPVLMDSKRQVHRRYGVRAIPTLFIVDREGTIRQHFIGSRSGEQLRAAILDVAKR